MTTDSGARGLHLEFPGEHVARITIATEPLGVMRVADRRALSALVRERAEDGRTRALILTGRGRAFSAGSNIREFEATREWLEEALEVESALDDALESAPFAVIAACNGATLGGGLVMALACDVRIACASATFAVPEVRIGAFPTATGTQRLHALLGRGRALWLIMTGETVDAQRALALGIVEDVVPDDALEARALEVATTIARGSPVSVSAAKACVRAGVREGWPAGLALERSLTAPVGLSEDAREGKAAFLDKRPPVFPGGRVDPG